jgi:hypothetical protein
MICPYCKEVIIKKRPRKTKKKEPPMLKIINEPIVISFE